MFLSCIQAATCGHWKTLMTPGSGGIKNIHSQACRTMWGSPTSPLLRKGLSGRCFLLPLLLRLMLKRFCSAEPEGVKIYVQWLSTKVGKSDFPMSHYAEGARAPWCGPPSAKPVFLPYLISTCLLVRYFQPACRL